MITPLPLLTDEQFQRSVPTDDEAGFGTLATERGHLPLEAMEVQARIDGLLAVVELRQTFVNSLGEPLEATYIFPLPDRAAVRRFRMEVAGRVIEGALQERAQARKEYEQAIQQGHRAAITEEERPNVFTLRVGNLMPGEKATVRLTLVGPLPVSDGEATFRFPLVVAPRYIPGTPLSGPSVGDGTAPDTDAVPDASRITPPVLLPGYPNPVRLALSVEVRSAGLPMSAFRSSLHAVLTEEEGQVRRIRLQPGERLDRDFILRFRLGDRAVKTALVLTPDEEGKEGTFALTILPPAGPASAQPPRDVVFILDRSGSMGGWKMVAARRALARMVDTLSDRDRFSILAFDNTIETVPDFHGVGLVAATNRNRFRAVEFLSTIDARGGTELAQPLDLGVRQLASGEAERDRILVLVTDGQVGNEDQILRSLAPHIRNLRIFTLGIDQAVNEAFLRRLAALGGGMCEMVESEDRLDEVMDKVHRRIGVPVLTGLRLEPAGLRFDPKTVVPARIPDLFAGVPLCILGRYKGATTGGFALQARDATGMAWAETVPATSSDNPATASIWARGHIRELEDRFACGSENRAKLEKRIVATSLRFSVLSRFTAFVAVDRSEVVNQGGKVQRITQPVEMPAGWAMVGTADAAVWPRIRAFMGGQKMLCCRTTSSMAPQRVLRPYDQTVVECLVRVAPPDHLMKPVQIVHLKGIVQRCLENKALFPISFEHFCQSLGAAICLRRKELGLTVAQLAQRTNVSNRDLSQIEHGQKSASVQILDRISQSLGVELAELFISVLGHPEGVMEYLKSLAAGEKEKGSLADVFRAVKSQFFSKMFILVIDDDPAVIRSVQAALATNEITVDGVSDRLLIEAVLQDKPYHVILVDYVVPGIETEKIMGWIHRYQPDASVIVLWDPDGAAKGAKNNQSAEGRGEAFWK